MYTGVLSELILEKSQFKISANKYEVSFLEFKTNETFLLSLD